MSPTAEAHQRGSTPSRVLVAVDGSVASLAAARLAISLAGSWRAQLRFIAVTGANAGPERPPQAPPDHEGGLQNALDYLCRLGAEAGVVVEGLLRKGRGAQPYELILDEADRWNADLLFVGRGRHHGLGRALLGSQAEHVLEFAQLPVVVVPESQPRTAAWQPRP